MPFLKKDCKGFNFKQESMFFLVEIYLIATPNILLKRRLDFQICQFFVKHPEVLAMLYIP